MTIQSLSNLSELPSPIRGDLSNRASLTNASVAIISTGNSVILHNISKKMSKEIPVQSNYTVFSPDNAYIATSLNNTIFVYAFKELATKASAASPDATFTFSSLITFKFATSDKILVVEQDKITVCDLKTSSSRQLHKSFHELGSNMGPNISDFRGNHISFSSDYTNFLISGQHQGSLCSIVISFSINRIIKVQSNFGVVGNKSTRGNSACVYLGNGPKVNFIELCTDNPLRKEIPVFSEGESIMYLHLSQSQTQLTAFSSAGTVKMISLDDDSVISEDKLEGYPVTLHEEKLNEFIMLMNTSNIVNFDFQPGTTVQQNDDVGYVDVSGIIPESNFSNNTPMDTPTTAPDFTSDYSQNTQPSYDFSNNDANMDNQMNLSSTSSMSASPTNFACDSQLDNMLRQGQIQEAIQFVIRSGDQYRTVDTLNSFKNCPSTDKIPPVIRYLVELVTNNTLKDFESTELAIKFIEARKTEASRFLNDWFNKNKLTPSEELGNVVRDIDNTLALKVYVKSQAHTKVCGLLLLMNQLDKLVPYAQKTGFQPDYDIICCKMYDLVSENKIPKENAKSFIESLVKNNPPLLQVLRAAEIAYQSGDYATYFSIVIQHLKTAGDRAQDAEIQTNFLMALARHKPELLPTILSGKELNLSHFDRNVVGSYLEEINMAYLSLLCYKEMDSIKRILAASLISSYVSEKNIFGPKQLIGFLKGQLKKGNEITSLIMSIVDYNRNEQNLISQGKPPETIRAYVNSVLSEVMLDLVKSEHNQDKLDWFKIVSTVEENGDYKCAFAIMSTIVTIPGVALDTNKVMVYLKACVSSGEHKEAERLIKEEKEEHLDKEQILSYLMNADLADPRPFIFFCDRFHFYTELTTFLVNNDKTKFLVVYVTKFNPSAAPVIVETMILNAYSDQQIKDLISQLDLKQSNVSKLIEIMLEKNKVELIKEYLEKEDQNNREICTALAKIYIYSNPTFAASYLKSNHGNIDLESIADFALHLDSFTAFLAYSLCDKDDKVIEMGQNKGWFKEVAEYLVRRSDERLWVKVLDEHNEYRGELVYNVVHVIIPTETNTDKVSLVVRAFIKANISKDLLELLEQIIIKNKNSTLCRDKNLQNLLILTAIKSDKVKVEEYISTLNNYDYKSIGEMAQKYELNEEAVTIFTKGNLLTNCFSVLLNRQHDYNRAYLVASDKNSQGMHDAFRLLIEAAVGSNFVKEGIELATEKKEIRVLKAIMNLSIDSNKYNDEILTYLETIKNVTRDNIVIDSILKILAKKQDIVKLNKFLAENPNVAIERIANDCFAERSFEVAAVLFEKLNRHEKTGLCYIEIKDFVRAMESVEKSGSKDLMKKLLEVTLKHKEVKIAVKLGGKMAISVDLVEYVVMKFEYYRFVNELVDLMIKASTNSKAQQIVFTQLGILLCKYRVDKLEDYIKDNWKNILNTQLLKVLNKYGCYNEVIVLLMCYKQYDNVLKTMVEHGPICFDLKDFEKAALNSVSSEVLFTSIQFLLEYYPQHFEEVLLTLGNKIDFRKVVKLAQDKNCLFFITAYLEKLSVTGKNRFVAEMLCNLYIEEEMKSELLRFIQSNELINHRALGKRLENHERVDFRKIGSRMTYKSGDVQKAISTAEKDNDYMTMSELVGLSKNKVKIMEFLEELKEKGLELFSIIVMANMGDWCSESFMFNVANMTGNESTLMCFLGEVIERQEKEIEKLKEKVNELSGSVFANMKVNKEEKEKSKGVAASQDNYNASRLALEGKNIQRNKSKDSLFGSGTGRSNPKGNEYGF
eukprot:GAHX01000232.1.p1 GENE.GAHX01000232.1~~GAHX01000232.1.p1  ORF type:complete len:1782 (-),score=358.81 GAHX01000232.1:21-5333(-)